MVQKTVGKLQSAKSIDQLSTILPRKQISADIKEPDLLLLMFY